MQRKKQIFAFAIVLILLSSLPLVSISSAQSIDSSQVLKDIQDSFLKVRSAEQQGANVTYLASQLTQALKLVQLADSINRSSPSLADAYYQQAEQLVSNVNSQIDQAVAQGKAEILARNIYIASYLGILAASGLFVYFYSGKIFWRYWLKLHSSWIAVKKVEGKNDR